MLEHVSAKLCKYFTLIELADSIGFPRPSVSPRSLTENVYSLLHIGGFVQSNTGCIDLRTGQNFHLERPTIMHKTPPLRLVSYLTYVIKNAANL